MSLFATSNNNNNTVAIEDNIIMRDERNEDTLLMNSDLYLDGVQIDRYYYSFFGG